MTPAFTPTTEAEKIMYQALQELFWKQGLIEELERHSEDEALYTEIYRQHEKQADIVNRVWRQIHTMTPATPHTENDS